MKTRIEKLINSELDRASEKFGDKNHSTHEGWAVLKEEVEEAEDEFNRVVNNTNSMWSAVKMNNLEYFNSYNKAVYDRAVKAIAELIQVSAMCKKNLRGFEK